MADVLFTMPGKVGDNLCKVPIAYQYSKQRACSVDVCLDQGSAGMISLLSNESWVDSAFCSPGVAHYALGGQPIDFGRAEEFRGRWKEVYHLGYRTWPGANLTACSINDTPINTDSLLTESCLSFEKRPTRNLLLQCESSRRHEDEFTAGTLASILEPGSLRFDRLIVSTFQTQPQDPIYDRLRRYEPQFIHCSELIDVARLLPDAALFTTWSAASCLAYIGKFPMVVMSTGGTWLAHYDNRQSYYGLDNYVQNDAALASATLQRLMNGI